MVLPPKDVKPRKRNKLVCGVGINDADYAVQHSVKIDGKWRIVWTCPIYHIWKHMLSRCYSEKFHQRKPTYKGCSVCEEWLYFSKFREWVIQQDWKDKHLDKDWLVQGNKVYSPETCIFVTPQINTFILECTKSQGDCMVGVSWHKVKQKFIARCQNPFTHKREHLGNFDDELEAHLAWKAKKHEFACQFADSQHCNDPRLAEVLRTRYL